MLRLTVRLPDDLADQIKRAAAREGTTFTDYIREAAIARLAHGLTAAEIADLRERVERLERAVLDRQ